MLHACNIKTEYTSLIKYQNEYKNYYFTFIAKM